MRNLRITFFAQKDQRKGILIKYDANVWSENIFKEYETGVWNIVEIKKDETSHVLIVESQQTEFIVQYDVDESAYRLINIYHSQNGEEYPVTTGKAPQLETTASILFYPITKKVHAFSAQDFTFDEAGRIDGLESYDGIVEKERKKEEEAKAIAEQLEIWNMSIEAEKIRLVDTPFNCIGIGEVRSTSADFLIDEFVADDNGESIGGMVTDILNYPIMSNDDGTFDLSFNQLKKVVDSGILVIEGMSSCSVTVDCNDPRKANDFRKKHRKDYNVHFEPDFDNYSVELTVNLDREKSNSILSIIKQFIDDVNKALEFNGSISERDVNCEDITFKAYRKETKEERTTRIDRLKGKEFIFGGKNGMVIGTLAKKGCDFSQLRIAFPQDKDIKKKKSDSEAQKIYDYLIDLKEKGDVKTLLTPNLTKERSILDREQIAVEKVKDGKDLKNPRLKDFIFNSEYARATLQFENVDITATTEYADCDKTHLLSMNDSQKEAVVKALYAQDLCLLQGPPGTGKTTVIAEMLWQHIRMNQSSRIMLTSQSNFAIDNALNRLLGEFVTKSDSDMQRYRTLVKPLRIADSEKLSEEGMRFTSERIDKWVADGTGNDNVVADWMQNISNRIDFDGSPFSDVLKDWRDALANPDANLRQAFAYVYEDSWNIMGMTCGKVGSADFKHNNGEDGFDVVIMDEASKCTPPELLMPICYGEKAIVIGDHRQLPPVLYEDDFRRDLLSLNNDRAKELAGKLKKYELETCLFKKLITNKNLSPTIKAALTVQYRMHPQINNVIAQFYQASGGLACGLDSIKVDSPNFNEKDSRYHGFSLGGVFKPGIHTLWIDVRDGEESGGGGESFENKKEVEVIGKMLTLLSRAAGYREYFNFWRSYDNIERSKTEGQIGLISFYAKQVQRLKSKIQSLTDKSILDSATIDIRADSVDNFQGQERGIVIVSTVRTNGKGGFTRKPERLNVALSRARRLLIVVGNSQFFSGVKDEDGNYIYRDVIEQIKANKGFIDSSELDEYLYEQ